MGKVMLALVEGRFIRDLGDTIHGCPFLVNPREHLADN